MPGPLADLRVLDLTARRPGAMLGMILADQGADVARMERGETGLAWAVWTRGRRRLRVLDGDEPALRRLLRRVDVVLRDEGSPELGPPPPHLIEVELPAWGDDHKLAGVPGLPGATAAYSGLFDAPIALRPIHTPLAVGAVLQALHAAVGLMGALLARRRDGRGQVVLVRQVDALLSAHELTALFTRSPPPSFSPVQWAASPFVDSYATRDGRRLYVHLGLGSHLKAFLVCADRHGMGEGARSLRGVLSARTLRDPTAVPTPIEAARARRALGALLMRGDAIWWERVLGDGGLCAVMLRTAAEWIDHPHALAAQHVVDLDDPELGVLRGVGPVIRLDASPPELRPRAPRTVRPSTLLRAWPAVERHLHEPDDRAPLAGLRLVDLTQVIAGPVAARALAELGAEVLRIENPRLRAGWVTAFHAVFNTHKRSVSLDLRRSDHRVALRDVLRNFRPELLVENFRPGALERLGVDTDALPGLRVVVSATAYGGSGPWAARPGWEQTAQALTGVQDTYGGHRGPELFPMPVSDVGTGLAGAFGALLGLWSGPPKGGAPHRVRATLAGTATLLQSGDLARAVDAPLRLQRGKGLGERPWARHYRCASGWVFLSCAPKDLPAAARALGAADATTEALGLALRPVDLVALHGALRDAELFDRVAIVPHRRAGAVLGNSVDGRVYIQHDPSVGAITHCASPLRLSRSALFHGEPASVRGGDSAAVLADVGHGDLVSSILPDVPEPFARLHGLVRTAVWGVYLALTRALRL